MNKADLDKLRADARMEQEDNTQPASAKLAELGKQMLEKKEELDALKAEKKRVQAEYDQLREELIPQAMAEAGIVSEEGKGSFSLPDGSTVYLTTSLYVSCRKADQEHLHQWLRANGLGDLIKETVHHQTLRAFAREQSEKGAPLPLVLTTHYVTKAAARS